MSTHKICICGEIRMISVFLGVEKSLSGAMGHVVRNMTCAVHQQ